MRPTFEITLTAPCNHLGTRLSAPLLQRFGFSGGQLLNAKLVQLNSDESFEIRCTPYVAPGTDHRDVRVTVPIQNRPGATSEVISALVDAKAKLLTIDAAANPGYVECLVRVPDYEAFGKLLSDKLEEVSLEPIAPANFREVKDGIAVVRDMDTELCLDLGEEIRAALEESILKTKKASLSECYSLVSIDPGATLLRLSFMTPNERVILLNIRCRQKGADANSILGVVLCWLADRNVDLRLVHGYSGEIPDREAPWRLSLDGKLPSPTDSPTEHATISIIADYSRSYLRIFSHRTLRAHIEASLRSTGISFDKDFEMWVTVLNCHRAHEVHVDVRNVFLLSLPDSARNERGIDVVSRFHRDGGRDGLQRLDERLARLRQTEAFATGSKSFADDLRAVGFAPCNTIISERRGPAGNSHSSLELLSLELPSEGPKDGVNVPTFLFALPDGNKALTIVIRTDIPRISDIVAKVLRSLRSLHFDSHSHWKVGTELYKQLHFDIPLVPDFVKAHKGDDRLFAQASRQRFTALRALGYLREKATIDRFPILADVSLSARLAQAASSRSLQNAKCLDVGCGPGSLSTVILVANLLARGVAVRPRNVRRIDILDSEIVRPVLLHEFQDALKDLRGSDGGDGPFTASLEILHRLSPSHWKDALAVVSDSEYVPADFQKIDPKECANRFDVVISCFTLHHLNEDAKRRLLLFLRQSVAPRGQVGITDETYDYGRFLNWQLAHLRTAVPGAVEAFWAVDDYKRELRNAGWEDSPEEIVPNDGCIELVWRRPAVETGKGHPEVIMQSLTESLVILVDGVHFSSKRKQSASFDRTLKAFVEAWTAILRKYGVAVVECQRRNGDEWSIARQDPDVSTNGLNMLVELLVAAVDAGPGIHLRGGVRLGRAPRWEKVDSVGAIASPIFDWAGHAEKGLKNMSHEHPCDDDRILAAFERSEWNQIEPFLKQQLDSHFKRRCKIVVTDSELEIAGRHESVVVVSLSRSSEK